MMGMANYIAGVDYSVSTASRLPYMEIPKEELDHSKTKRKADRRMYRLNHYGGEVGRAIARNQRKQKRKLVRKARRLTR